MRETIVNIRAAKMRLSELVALAERGKRIMITRAGKPVVQLVAVSKRVRRKLPPDDPLLNLDKFGFDGPRSNLTNEEIDRMVYGA